MSLRQRCNGQAEVVYGGSYNSQAEVVCGDSFEVVCFLLFACCRGKAPLSSPHKVLMLFVD